MSTTISNSAAIIPVSVTHISRVHAGNASTGTMLHVSANNKSVTSREDSNGFSEEEIKQLREARFRRHVESIKARHAKAEEHIRLGNEIMELEDGDICEATSNYAQASNLCPSSEEAAIKLIENVAVCGTLTDDASCFRNAETLATQLLIKRPKLNAARWYRGTVRLALGWKDAAYADFNTILVNEPNHEPVLAICTQLGIAIPSSTNQSGSKNKSKKSKKSKRKGKGSNQTRSSDPIMDSVFNFPPYESPSLDYESLSDTSDREQIGNGVPCRHYNKKPAGCRPYMAEMTPALNGKCRFKHAPDGMAVRDSLGRNVCLFYLLGVCKFGDEKCFYSHEKTWLPSKGWWNDETQTEMMKDLVVGKYKNLSGRCPGSKVGLQQWMKKERDDMRLTLIKSLLEEGDECLKAFKINDIKKLFESLGLNSDNEDDSEIEEDDNDDIYDRPGYGSCNYHDSDLDDSDEDDLEYGFSRDDLEELACQGVKPWDDDAYDVLRVLNSC